MCGTVSNICLQFLSLRKREGLDNKVCIVLVTINCFSEKLCKKNREKKHTI